MYKFVCPSETDNGLKISPQGGMLFHNLKDKILKAVTSLTGKREKAQVLDDTASDEEFEHAHDDLPRSG